jgi:predicted ATPase
MFIRKVNFDFSTLPPTSYLNTLPYLDQDSISFSKSIIFLTGENGVGKSTLLESLAYHFNINREGGSNNFILDKTNFSPLFEYISIEGSQSISHGFFFRSDTFFSIEEVLDEYGKDLKYTYNGGNKTFKEQSHGEGFMSFFRSRLGSNALYFFDEPENALSFENQVLFFILT